ncbi:MAG: hypothetical protein ACTH31_15505, partial [Pseudoclavibacter sp.]
IVTRRPLIRAAQVSAAGFAVESVPRAGAGTPQHLPSVAVPIEGGATRRTSDSRDRREDAGRRRVVTIGEPELWQQSFGALGQFARSTDVILDDVPPGTMRSLLPGEPLPPPVVDPARDVLLRDSRGAMHRFAWPLPHE